MRSVNKHVYPCHECPKLVVVDGCHLSVFFSKLYFNSGLTCSFLIDYFFHSLDSLWFLPVVEGQILTYNCSHLVTF